MIAEKSIKILPTDLAREVLEKAQTTLERMDIVERAQKQMPPELKEEIRRKIEPEKAIEFRKLFKSESAMWASN